MDAPTIQYCKTSDGVSIAYWTMGEGGTPLVMTTPRGVSHIGLECDDAELFAWYERLAQQRMIVRFDGRGFGLSERELDDDAIARSFGSFDIAAVLGRLGLERLDLLASSLPAVDACQFAAERPELVERMVLVSPAHGADFARHPEISAVLALAKDDWRLFTETWAHIFMGWSQGELARKDAALFRRSTTQDFMVRARAAMLASDLTSYLERIRAATLILTDARGRAGSDETARLVATGVRDARLARYEAGPGGFYRSEQARTAIEGFLARDKPAKEAASSPPPSGTAIILFADVVDSTALQERLGNTTFRDRSGVLEERVRAQIVGHAGTPVEGRTLGDGVLGTFTSASDAIAAAIECASAGEEVGLALHLGLHAGDVLREAGNVSGQAVSIASRISGLSAPNEILVSGTVRDLARASAGVSFEDRGEHELKGVSEPVRVFAVRAGGESPLPFREGAGG